MPSPLAGPNKSHPTPRQIAGRLLANLPEYDARILFDAWWKAKENTQEYMKLSPEIFQGEQYFTREEASEAFRKEVETIEGKPILIEKPEAMTEEDLMALDLPPIEWIVNKVIPKGGLVAISGAPGSFKSYFALWMARRIATGLPLFCDDDLEEPFFCPQITSQSPVMFIEEENTQIMTRSRLLGFRRPSSAALHLRVMQGFKVQDETWRKALLVDVERHGIKVIFMDPFSSVMGLKDENNNAEVSGVMDTLRQEFLEKGITVVFLHHPAKSDSENASLRGAGDILGKCDVHLLIERDKVDKRMTKISFKKMRLISEEEVQDFKIRLTGDPLIHDERFRYLGAAETTGDETQRKILEAMEDGEEYSRKEIAEALGLASGGRPFGPAWKVLEGERRIYKTMGGRKYIKKGGEQG